MTQVHLVFDDGFVQSCRKVAALFEARGLSAVFAVMVEPGDFMPQIEKGDWDFWRSLRERGHVIQPHGWDHSDLSTLPLEDALERVDRCLAAFANELPGFEASDAGYYTTYNRSTPELDAALLDRVAYVRRTPGGEVGTGLLDAESLSSGLLSCAWQGPEDCGEHFLRTLLQAEQDQPACLHYMMHGVDGEGWGPISSSALAAGLDFIQNSMVLTYSSRIQL